MRHKWLIVTWGICALNTFGACDNVSNLRSFFKEEAISTKPRLEVTVEPAKGFKLYIDGELKASSSPYRDVTIPYGQHRLKITAPGYYPVEMPLELVADKPLSFPISMRILPAGAAETAVTEATGKKPAGDNSAALAAQPEAAASAAEEAEEAKPQAIERQPVNVRLGLSEAATVFLDGKKVAKDNSVPLRFHLSFGTLKVRFTADETMEFAYEINEKGELRVEPKGDISSWRRNNSKVMAERSYFIGLQPQRFEASLAPGNKKAVIFKIVSE